MRRSSLLAVVLAASVTVPLPAQSVPATCSVAHEVPTGAAADCKGIYPGVPLYVTVAGDRTRDCGAGFMFTDAKGDRYFAVSAYCVYDPICLEERLVHIERPQLPGPLEGVLQMVAELVCIAVPSGKEGVFTRNAPVVFDTNMRRIGVVAYAVDKTEVSFGLVKLDKSVQATGEVPYWGGPTTINNSSTSLAGGLTKVFSTNVTGTVPGVPRFNARRALAPTGWGATQRFTVLASQGTSYYNSHGVVLDERGGALGYIEFDTLGLYSSVTQLEDGITRAEKVAKLKLKLVTAPTRR